MKKRLLPLLFLGFALLFVLAACGGGDDTTDNADQGEANTEDTATNGDSGNTLDITATNFEFNQEEYTVNAGEPVSINFSSEEGTHGLGVDGFDVNIEGEGSATFTPEEPGEYTIRCTVPCGAGHADMMSTLIVQ